MPGVRQRTKKGRTAYDTPNDEKRAYGRRLREAREIAGLSQAQAADALGYSQAVQLSLMETGQRMPPLRLLLECAKLYGTTMDYLCGLVADSDRDPAIDMQRYIASRVSADLQRLITQLTHANAEVVRKLMPSAGDGQRLAALVGEVNVALAAFRERNPKFDDMRGGATLASKIELSGVLARQYLAQFDRGRRLMTARLQSDARGSEDRTGQFNLLPALDAALEHAGA